jgi:protein-tyrosine-phosphatase
MIKAAQTPIERQLKEVALPGLNVSGAATGNLDSSRSAMAEAILRRSAGEDESNIASNILGTQYNNGLNLAESARVANQNALGKQ